MMEGPRKVHAKYNLVRDGAFAWIVSVEIDGLLVEGLGVAATTEPDALREAMTWTNANVEGLMMLRDQWHVEGGLASKRLWLGGTQPGGRGGRNRAKPGAGAGPG